MSLAELEHRIYRSGAVQRGMTRIGLGYQRLLAARATDITAAVEQRRCLVVAPHPDDETLGCGATIARKVAAGTPVRVVVVADGRHANPSRVISPEELAAIRRAEGHEALRRLGLGPDHATFVGLEDTRVGADEDAAASALAAEIAGFRPDEVLVPAANDAHPDHRAVNRAARRALAQAGCRAVVLEYPVWFWTAKSWLEPKASPARQAVQLVVRPLVALARLQPRTVAAGPYLEAKRHALDAHRSQLTSLTGEPDWPVMEPAFLETFLRPYELYFADRVACGRGRGRP